jgi:hypothetical protein
LTGLVTGERNHEEPADRGFAVTAVTAKYLNSQRLRLVSSEDGWRARALADKDTDMSVKGIRAEAAVVIASLVSVGVARGTGTTEGSSK